MNKLKVDKLYSEAVSEIYEQVCKGHNLIVLANEEEQALRYAYRHSLKELKRDLNYWARQDNLDSAIEWRMAATLFKLTMEEVK